jgi:hypothetical protein
MPGVINVQSGARAMFRAVTASQAVSVITMRYKKIRKFIKIPFDIRACGPNGHGPQSTKRNAAHAWRGVENAGNPLLVRAGKLCKKINQRQGFFTAR